MPDGYFYGKPFIITSRTLNGRQPFYTICYANGKCENVTEDTIRHHAPSSQKNIGYGIES